MVEGDGFEPPNPEGADLQSAAFSHFATPPHINIRKNGGGRGIRTPARFNPPVGFQDRSLQPNLGIPPFFLKKLYKYFNSGGGDRTPDLTGMNRTL
jgi:hypothetical protein